MAETPSLVEAHLSLVIKNGVALLGGQFVIGAAGGWALSLIPKYGMIAFLAFLPPLLGGVWMMVLFRRTRGIMNSEAKQ